MFAAADLLGKMDALRGGLAQQQRRAQPPQVREGDRVEAKIAGWKQPYKGQVQSVDEDLRACRVVFDDGEVVDEVRFDEILAVETSAKAAGVASQGQAPGLGDRVSARVAGWKKPYSGTVTKVVRKDAVFEVTFDDGEVIDDVQRDEIVSVLASSADAAAPQHTVKEGMRVRAKVAGWKKPYEGLVTGIIEAGRVFAVTFDDGEVIDDVQVDEIIEILSSAPKDELLSAGTRVKAKLKGWKQAYSGVIDSVKSGKYKIVFDDGEVQNAVDPSLVEEAPSASDESDEDCELFAEGTRVKAKLKGWKQAYPGVIESVKNGKYRIVFDDGEVQDAVDPSLVEETPSAGSKTDEENELIAKGTRIKAKLKGWKQAYPGVIDSVKNGKYKIVFDDGEVQHDVDPSLVEEIGSEIEDAGEDVQLLAKGTRVNVKLKGWKQAYPGVIESAKNGKYKIVFEDGEVQDAVDPSLIETIGSEDENAGEDAELLAKGTRIEAKLKGWKQAYPGIIESVKNGKYKIVFDDGEVQDAVDPSLIEKIGSENENSGEDPALLANGTRVQAKLDGWKQAYPGVIESVKNGKYEIVFDDGEVQDAVDPSLVEEIGCEDEDASEDAELLAKGTRVKAKLDGWKQAYPGVVESVRNGKYKIVFDDGEVQDAVDPTDFEVLPRPASVAQPICVGSRVKVQLPEWKQAYEGTVTTVHDDAQGGFRVVFDDGEVVERVADSQISECIASKEEDAGEDAELLAKGTRVKAKLEGWKQAYPGVIESAKNGKYKIVFDDGEVQDAVDQSAFEVLPCPASGAQPICVGSRVKVQLPEWKQAYEGTVTTVHEDAQGGFRVVFDDGEVVERVADIQISECLAPATERAPGATHEAGERVRAKLSTWKQAYSGTIMGVNADGSLRVEFDDGEVVESLATCDIVDEQSPRRSTDVANDEDLLAFLNDEKELGPDAPAEDTGAENTGTANEAGSLVELEPSPGDVVMAKMPTWKSAYQGTVKRRNAKDGSFKIIFDDGEAVNAVPKTAITKIVARKTATGASGQGSAFTAPDGKTFADSGAFKKYMYETYYCFKNKEGDHESLVKVPGSVDGQPFDLHTIHDCTVRVLCWSSQVQIDKITQSKLFIGPCESSVFIRDCRDCEFTIACRQLRLRDCENCTFNLFSNVDPVIETSTGLVFRPFNGAYAGLREHFTKAKLDPGDNHWRQIFDFNKDGCDGYGVPDPHYRLEEAKGGSELAWEWTETGFPGPGECANPVAPDAVATTQSDGGATHQGQFTEQGAAAGLESAGPSFVWAKDGHHGLLVVGAVVSVNFNRESKKPRAGDFYSGHVKAINADGTFAIAYDDGDVEDDCKLDFIKVAVPEKDSADERDSKLEAPPATKSDGQDETLPQKKADDSTAQPDIASLRAKQGETRPQEKAEDATVDPGIASSRADSTGCATATADTTRRMSPNPPKAEVARTQAPEKLLAPPMTEPHGKFRWAKDVPGLVLVPGAAVRVNFARASDNPNDSDFYTGKIRSNNNNGSYVVAYDDGDVEEDCKLEFMQVASENAAQAAAAGAPLPPACVDAERTSKPTPRIVYPVVTMEAVRAPRSKGVVAKAQNTLKHPVRRGDSGRPLTLRLARSVEEALRADSVLVHRGLDADVVVDLGALEKGVVSAVNSDGSLEVQFESGRVDEAVSLSQIHVLSNSSAAAPRRRGVSAEEHADYSAITMLRAELGKLREEQRLDQVRMRKERKAQEARILEQRRKQAQSLAASRSQARQSALVETMQKEISAQREFQQQLMQQHQEAMEKLQTRLVDLSLRSEDPDSVPMPPPNSSSGLTSVGAAMPLAELEAIRQEIVESRVALQQDMKAAAAHAREMERLTREKELERGWNAGAGRHQERGRSASLSRERKASRARSYSESAAALENAESEVIAEAMNELEEAKKQRTEFLLAMKRRQRAENGRMRHAGSNLGLRMAEHRANVDRAAKLVLGLYEGYESERTGKVVRSPGPAEICTPQWTQRVSELQLKPLHFRARAHDDKEWRRVGLALARIHVEGLRFEGASSGRQAGQALEKAWVDWTIASNKELHGTRVSAALARKLGIIASSVQAREAIASGFGGEEDDVEFDGLCFTHRQCERRMLKRSRQDQRGDFARAHIVPDVPLGPEARLQNSLYKKVCHDEWAKLVERAQGGLGVENDDPCASGDGPPNSVAAALEQLQLWGKTDREAKHAEALRRAAERKAGAARDFEQWKQLKEKSQVNARTVDELRASQAESCKAAFPRPAGRSTDVASAFAADRALPLRYAGSGRLRDEETNYMHAAQRTSLPERGQLAQALKSKAAGKCSVRVARSQDPQNPWKNVEETENELRQLDAQLAAQEDAEKERAVQAQRGFLAWEDAIKVQERVTQALAALDFRKRCLRTTGDGGPAVEDASGMDEWLLVGRALHALHHAQSRALFQAWADWTVRGVSRVLGEPILGFARCTLKMGGNAISLEAAKGAAAFAEGTMLWIARDPVSRPGGKLSPEGLAVQIDRKVGDLAVVGAANVDDEGGSLVHCAWKRVPATAGGTVFAYPIPSLLVRVILGGTASSRGHAPWLNRLRDSHQLSAHIRGICADQWRSFMPGLRWFSERLGAEDEALLCGEVAKFKRMRHGERIRAKLLDLGGEARLAKDARDRAQAQWLMVLQNPALASSMVVFQERGEDPGSMPRVDPKGQPFEDHEQPIPASLRVGDLVCLNAQDKDVRSAWHKGSLWYRVAGLCMVRKSAILVRDRRVKSAGDGALAFRVRLAPGDDKKNAPSSKSGAEDGALELEECVPLHRMLQALVVRMRRNAEPAEDAAFDMFVLPGAGVFASAVGARMIALADQDLSAERCRAQEAEASARIALQESGDRSFDCFEKMLLGDDGDAVASDELVTRHLDAVGKALARAGASWRRAGVVPRLHSDGSEETKDEGAFSGACPWRLLWRSWVLSSQKWAELVNLGFQLSDMDGMMDRKWAKFSDANKQPGSRDPLGTSHIILADLGAMLAGPQ